MLQQEQGDDYVVATGETHTVKEFLEVVFEHAGLDVNEYVEIDERLFRPHEVAHRVLGWEPKTRFEGLAKMMYDSDLAELKK
jgi:GDPmannose 4,6-dehydratase